MNKIKYHYTNVPKQIFCIALFIYILLRFTVILQVQIYKIPEYYNAINFPLTTLMYAALFVLIFCIFFGHRFFYAEYGEEQLVYHNKLLRRHKALCFADIDTAILDTFGIKFYRRSQGEPSSSTTDRDDFAKETSDGGVYADGLSNDRNAADRDASAIKTKKPVFFLPFFRGGIIEAVDANDFYLFLRAKTGLSVSKTFKVLPGYSKRWMAVSILYAFLAIAVFINCNTPVYTIIILYQNH